MLAESRPFVEARLEEQIHAMQSRANDFAILIKVGFGSGVCRIVHAQSPGKSKDKGSTGPRSYPRLMSFDCDAFH
jgi:hypothetical protein